MLKKRYLESVINEDALSSQKMALISGPRQCGKTTAARGLLEAVQQTGNYWSWDDDEFRRMWVRSPKETLNHLQTTPGQTPRVVLDELHKYSRWKNSLKGLYDLTKDRLQIVVTGSARLDYFRRGGDSLTGRYFPYRLHPFSLGEIDRIKPPPTDDFFSNCHVSFPFSDLLRLGGFPEPLLGGDDAKAARWRRLHRERLIREDLRDLKSVRDINLLETLAVLLVEKAGTALSFNSLKEDLRIAFATTQDWVSLLEAVYFCFLIRPYSKKISRAIQKEPKIYLFDWAGIDDPGRRLENMVACHLLKACHAWTDAAYGEFSLHYVRDKEKREVDFLILKDRKPYALIEVKTGDATVSPQLIHFAEMLKPQFVFQVVQDLVSERLHMSAQSSIAIVKLEKFLSALP